jgi:AcrR family transcriptional regulator
MSREHQPESDTARRREVIRQVAEAGRDAVRSAREAARFAGQDERLAAVTAARDAREALRDVARQARSGARPDDAAPGTRTRIQQVAVELFTEHGYEATSLREIAERLGVTKAALYYHYRTKDEIIESLVSDQVALIDQLIEWAEAQPRTVETRREFVRRYSDMLTQHDHHKLMRFFERNQSSMQQHKSGGLMRERMSHMLDVLTEPDAPLPDQIRCTLAIFAMHSTWFTVRDPDVTDDQRRVAALEVALDLVG